MYVNTELTAIETSIQNTILISNDYQDKMINLMEAGGIEPHTRVVAQGLTPYCDHIVTTFFSQYREVLECLFME